ncbi:hypothetical protein LF41_1516 [Lysobacter dokdonensis DS-58]|uniref:Uncharacterized protein n=1 Tax=Lysobacter dokdonensis DS-58 TaxID=1300345 RepID=A0A0A2WHK3_9GAMM|nr:hypothetical protein LF41_1516 [Lysobacter dokdonensis DS-58]
MLRNASYGFGKATGVREVEDDCNISQAISSIRRFTSQFKATPKLN